VERREETRAWKPGFIASADDTKEERARLGRSPFRVNVDFERQESLDFAEGVTESFDSPPCFDERDRSLR